MGNSSASTTSLLLSKIRENEEKEKKIQESLEYRTLKLAEQTELSEDMLREMNPKDIRIFLEVKEECSKRNIKCSYSYGFIHIHTRYEFWKFAPTNGKIALFHKNSINFQKKGNKDYHLQFREWISIPNLISYIDEHGRAKYTAEFVRFSQNIAEVTHFHVQRNRKRKYA